MRQRLIMGTVAAVFVTFPFATGGFGAGTDPASSSHRLDRLDAKRPGAASAPDVYQFQVEGVYEAARAAQGDHAGAASGKLERGGEAGGAAGGFKDHVEALVDAPNNARV